MTGNGTVLSTEKVQEIRRSRQLVIHRYQLAALPAVIAQVPNLKTLVLDSTQLTELPAEIVQLSNLQKLWLDNNWLTTLPWEVAQLPNLQALMLNGNRLTTLPPWVAELTNLRTLMLNRNRLTTLPAEIGHLTGLEALLINSNQLTILPAEIGQLTNLQTLMLNGNRLTILPAEIGQLTNLQTLMLNGNRLTTLPAEIGQLTNLQTLTLDNNQLTNLPAEVAQLTNLQTLMVNGNQLTTLPSAVAQLSNLRELGLDGNRMPVLSPEIGQLNNLQELRLAGNRFTELPAEIARLTKLQKLRLGRNQLTELPPEIADQIDKGLELGDLKENPLTEPLPELLEQGSRAVAVYLRSLRDGIAQHEAKVLLVGEGEVGKTSLCAAMRGDAFVPGRPFTHGINVQSLTLRHPHETLDMTIRLWDFGGQEIYRITHQFFFSQRALYVVVWKPRQGQEQNEVEGWLRRIRLRVGPAARVLVVATHCAADQHPDLDYPRLQQEFPEMLAGHFAIDNETGHGIPQLREAIARQAAELPQMGQRISARWAAVRDEIMTLAQSEPQISFQEFTNICQSNRVVGDEINTLAALMHDLGQIIYYGDDEGLQEFVVLNPEWLTTAISYVLRDQPTRQSGGILDHARLRRIWQGGPGYPARYNRYFLRLMEKFDISYRIEHEHRSLVAQLAPYERPVLPWDFLTPVPSHLRRLALICEISESAPGLMAWLTVRHHAAETGCHWRAGVFLRHPIPIYASEAILELRTPNELTVEVRAPSPDLFFHVLSDSIEALVSSRWPGLNYQFLIPCPYQNTDGSPCIGKFPLNGLRRLRERELVSVPCMHCAQEYEIGLLLTGFARPTQGLGAEVQRQLTRVEDRLIRIEGQAADAAATIRSVLRVVSTEVPDCPSLFTLAQDRATGDRRLKFHQNHYRLILWCQHPGYWHPWKHATYEIDPPKEWFVKISPYAALVLRTLQLMVPLAGSIAVASQPAGQIESAAAHLDMMKTLVDELPGKPPSDISETGLYQATGQMTFAEGDSLREFRVLIFKHDPLRKFGGLRRVLTPSGDFLWVCPNHAAEYDPGLPILP